MPTIAQLAPALAASDADAIPADQGGMVRKLTRAQLLAGVQPALALPEGALIGRSSAGTGEPEAITVGGGLRLADGVLLGPAPFSVGALPAGQAPAGTDLVALAQGGHDAAVPYATLMAGLGALGGVDLSRHSVLAAGATRARTLAELAADSVPAEAFGAAGDGITDDTAAIDRAVASGRPVRLGPRSYVVNGQWTVTRDAVLLGVPGVTVLRRAAQSGGAWIAVAGGRFVADGIVFDANRTGLAANGTADSWGVLVTPGCSASSFSQCVFANARGASLGSGLVIQSNPAECRHIVRACEARGNEVHGLWVQAVAGAQVLGCSAHGNGAYGVCLDFNDPAFVAKVSQGVVTGNRCWNNQRGISVGNFNETNAEPPRWGNANPDAVDCVVSGNACYGNSAYGIAVAGQGMLVTGNVAGGNGGGGILATVSQSAVSGNLVSGPSPFGVDAGGSVDSTISGNQVSGCEVGINPGGSRGVRVADNLLSGNGWAVTAYSVETDGQGRDFGQSTTGLCIADNVIRLRDGQGGGILLADAPQDTAVTGNRFSGPAGTTAYQCLWAHTDSLAVRDNRWGAGRMFCNPAAVGGRQQVQVPDIADEVMISTAPGPVGSMMTQRQAAVAGQIGFVRITAGGSGYTHASIAIGGSGTGAAATAYVRDGAVIGVRLTNPGSGYAGAASVTVSGDGQGAAAAAQVGLPVPEQRRLRVHCNCAVRFTRAGSDPFQDNWTLGDITVPAGASVEWTGTFGSWRAGEFPLGEFLAPPGDGTLVMRTVSGDLTLRPAGSGAVRVGSDAEPWGYVSALGRGSPEGVVRAPPGSDYRNLDGGAGSTLWLKRQGSEATGWAAVA